MIGEQVRDPARTPEQAVRRTGVPGTRHAARADTKMMRGDVRDKH